MEFPFQISDLAVVRVEKGEDLGKVVHLLERLPENRTAPEHEVLRRATRQDLQSLESYRGQETEAKQICKEKIANHSLAMKLVDVEYQFDGRKLIFYFTADGRIDFRQLVKDLAATFRTRIELRQIGARDETRRFGGLGPCGLQLCCAVFIREFCPITTQMAKDQNLPLNPSKISGCCGRLKCCLQYELEEYRESLKILPRWDMRIKTAKGNAVVEKMDVYKRLVYLRYQSGDQEVITEADLNKLTAASSPEVIPDNEVSAELKQLDAEELQSETSGRCRTPESQQQPPRPKKGKKPYFKQHQHQGKQGPQSSKNDRRPQQQRSPERPDENQGNQKKTDNS
ncbi:stage 0 sporulation protein [bacterium]|nr:stage 0 sporulation protein [bacterium]